MGGAFSCTLNTRVSVGSPNYVMYAYDICHVKFDLYEYLEQNYFMCIINNKLCAPLRPVKLRGALECTATGCINWTGNQ